MFDRKKDNNLFRGNIFLPPDNLNFEYFKIKSLVPRTSNFYKIPLYIYVRP